MHNTDFRPIRCSVEWECPAPRDSLIAHHCSWLWLYCDRYISLYSQLIGRVSSAISYPKKQSIFLNPNNSLLKLNTHLHWNRVCWGHWRIKKIHKSSRRFTSSICIKWNNANHAITCCPSSTFWPLWTLLWRPVQPWVRNLAAHSSEPINSVVVFCLPVCVWVNSVCVRMMMKNKITSEHITHRFSSSSV